jgi:hypothetical protein
VTLAAIIIVGVQKYVKIKNENKKHSAVSVVEEKS